MATPVLAFTQIATECEKDGLSGKNVERIAAELAKLFSVNLDEVAILRAEKSNLVFVHPAKLAKMGSIPINTTGAVAARTASTKRAEVINAFPQSKHISVFEAVDLGNKPKPSGGMGTPGEDKHAFVIQKLMSAPVLGAEGVLGVVEVCRKGTSGPSAGTDFSPMDLQKLVAACGALGKCFK
jgi:hypothetical protein